MDDDLASDRPLVPRPQELLLIDTIGELPGERLLCNSAGRGQFAAAWTAANPNGQATCWFLDRFQCDQAALANPAATNVSWLCAADPPEDRVSLAALVCSARGDGELTRESLQLFHERLELGGRFVAAIDNPRDQWLHEELQKLFAKVTRRPSETGVVYLATKHAELKKRKNYACEFEIRDQERPLKLRTRPSVFSHRRLDGGARALLTAMDIQPQMKVVDFGCGCGAVGLAAARRGAEIEVVGVDSNPRAVEAFQWGALANEIPRATANCAADGSVLKANSFDVVLANPPYYSNHAITKIFVEAARHALVPGGNMWLVTKRLEWYEQALPEWFRTVTAAQVGSYLVLCAVQ